MKFSYSKHALEQMKQRNISRAVADDILQNPDQVITIDSKQIYQSVITEKNKRYLVRIFVNNSKRPNIVITAYKTSKVTKYYEG